MNTARTVGRVYTYSGLIVTCCMNADQIQQTKYTSQRVSALEQAVY